MVFKNKMGIRPLSGNDPLPGRGIEPMRFAYEASRRHISEPPSEYLKHLFFDAVNFDPKALQLALELVGPDQILAGSDYPHVIGSLARMKESISGMGLSTEDQAKVFGGNARRILKLPLVRGPGLFLAFLCPIWRTLFPVLLPFLHLPSPHVLS